MMRTTRDIQRDKERERERERERAYFFLYWVGEELDFDETDSFGL
jgi:hypothetical protein